MSKLPDPNSRGYTNALLEDMNDKIQVILEVTKPIPGMQEELRANTSAISSLQAKADAHTSAISGLQDKVSANTSAIASLQVTVDATFEEVGRLRVDVDEIKRSLKDINHRLSVLEAAMKLLDRHSSDIQDLKKRVRTIERAIAG